MNSKYPIYVISKGRWETRLTIKALENINQPFRVVIEKQEYDQYAAVVDPSKILVLPFSNLGQGSIPARNWVWEHSIEEGHAWHWILDDNLRGFFRFNRNLLVPVTSGSIFRVAERHVERYENVGQAGFNYYMFVPRKTIMPPFYLNTRVYSCILIRNDIEHRWRGRYNEDTDLSIRILKDREKNWCTILFNAFICDKMQTMTMKGGNTESLYTGVEDGRLKMAKHLQEQHPEIVKITWKWGRWQHHVDYSFFQKKKLVLKEGIELSNNVDNHGMVYQENVDGSWVTTDPGGSSHEVSRV